MLYDGALFLLFFVRCLGFLSLSNVKCSLNLLFQIILIVPPSTLILVYNICRKFNFIYFVFMCILNTILFYTCLINFNYYSDHFFCFCSPQTQTWRRQSCCCCWRFVDSESFLSTSHYLELNKLILKVFKTCCFSGRQWHCIQAI